VVEIVRARERRPAWFIEAARRWVWLLGWIPPEFVLVEFPESTDFIKVMPNSRRKKLEKLRWDYPKTKFFEIPYLITFLITLEPATVAVYLIEDFEHNVYYRTLVYLEKWVDVAEDLWLEDDIEHEKMEIKETEGRARKGLPLLTPAEYYTREFETRKKTAKILAKRHKMTTKEVDDKLLGEWIKAWDLQRRDVHPTIGGGVLEFWLRKYMLKNYEKFKENAIPLTPEWRAAREAEYKKSMARMKKYYWDRFRITV